MSSRLRTTGTHGGERLVTRGVDEGDLALFVVDVGRDLVGTDVLGDATGLARDHVGLADRVEESGLTVVDVTHDGHDRRTGDQSLFAALVLAELDVEGLEQLAVLLLGADDLQDVVHLLGEKPERLVGNGLRGGDHLAEVHHHGDERRRVGVDLLREVGERGAARQPDGLSVAAGQHDAADRRGLHGLVLLAPLPLRLTATTRGYRRDGRTHPACHRGHRDHPDGHRSPDDRRSRRHHRDDRHRHRHRDRPDGRRSRRHRRHRDDRRSRRHRDDRHRHRRDDRHRRDRGTAAGTGRRQPAAGRCGIMPGSGGYRRDRRRDAEPADGACRPEWDGHRPDPGRPGERGGATGAAPCGRGAPGRSWPPPGRRGTAGDGAPRARHAGGAAGGEEGCCPDGGPAGRAPPGRGALAAGTRGAVAATLATTAAVTLATVALTAGRSRTGGRGTGARVAPVGRGGLRGSRALGCRSRELGCRDRVTGAAFGVGFGRTGARRRRRALPGAAVPRRRPAYAGAPGFGAAGRAAAAGRALRLAGVAWRGAARLGSGLAGVAAGPLQCVGQLAHNRRLDRRGRRTDEFTEFLELGHDDLALDAELLGEFVYPDPSHFAPLGPGYRRPSLLHGRTHRVLIECSSQSRPTSNSRGT